MKNKVFLLAFVLIGWVSERSFAQSGDTLLFDLGYVQDNIYYNDFFSFEFKIPHTWDYKLDKDQKITKKAIKKVYSENNELREYIDPDEIKMAILIIINRRLVYGGPNFSPNMLIMIEKIPEGALMRTGADYLTASARGLKLSNPKVKISKAEYGRYDFGKTFYSMDTKSKVGGMKIHQTFYSTVIGDFVFSALATYQEKDHLVEILEILKGFEFEK